MLSTTVKDMRCSGLHQGIVSLRTIVDGCLNRINYTAVLYLTVILTSDTVKSVSTLRLGQGDKFCSV